MIKNFDSDGVLISYLDEGNEEDEPILLIHGFASNIIANWVQTGWVKRLVEENYRVIAIDNRGHGESQKLYELEEYGAPLMAEDARRLLDHLGLEQAFVMGYSMGARIAAFLTLHHETRVKAAIFSGLGINMVRGLAGTGPIATALLAEHKEDVTNKTARTFRDFAEATGSDLKALAACIQSSREKITAEALRKINIPVLVAVGTKDVIGGSASELAELIPGATALDIPERDHMRAVADRVFKQGVLEFLHKE